MCRFAGFLWAVACLIPGLCWSQELLSDVFAGKLIQPEVGVYAIYDLTDTSTGKRFLLRQAIVGEESVKHAPGYWVEVELVPELGFPTVFKMLVTGPASEARNVHRIIVMEGGGEPQELPVDAEALKSDIASDTPRKSAGTDRIPMTDGEIEAEHFVLGNNEADQCEVWTNDTVRPTGIVRMRTPNGELTLRRYGKGGPDSVSAIKTEPGKSSGQPKSNISVRVEGTEPSTTQNPPQVDGAPPKAIETEKKAEEKPPKEPRKKSRGSQR